MLDVRPLPIADVLEIRPRRFEDERGYFEETYSAPVFAAAGLPTDWIQDNRSLSRRPGTLRGLHFQRPPNAQAKLVSVLSGSIFDVAVDLRQQSATRGRWTATKLTAGLGNQLLIPAGFAHGFLTLEPDCLVTYKVNAPYAPADEGAIRFDDPDIGIDWPEVGEFILSDKDKSAPSFADLVTGF